MTNKEMITAAKTYARPIANPILRSMFTTSRGELERMLEAAFLAGANGALDECARIATTHGVLWGCTRGMTEPSTVPEIEIGKAIVALKTCP